MAPEAYATIPKSRREKGIDRTHFRCLDKVYVGIGFGDTVAVGLVFVDRATCYNWVFALKSLAKEETKTAVDLFRAEAGWFAKCF